ncbi:MAG: NUDIX hydrolase [Candidatus Shapirobacteria bacterium]|nr:NUDIX hydrolase [Candidatus Shapirobacteria bacterium]
MEKNRPKVGIAVCVINNNKILLGNRIGSHGNNTWAFPGGHLEFNESFEECSIREVKEETSISIKNIRFLSITNDVFKKEKKHYITIFIVANYFSGEVRIMEPNKCREWKWFDWDNLPQPLFLPIKNLIKQKINPLNF